MSDQVDTEHNGQTAVTTESVATTRLKPWKAFLISNRSSIRVTLRT